MEKEEIKVINNLIYEVRDGNEDSLKKLHKIMSPTLHHIALKYLKNVHDAQDIVQDFWADVYKLCSAFIFSQNGFSFLCKAMTRRSINAYKKLHRQGKVTVNYVDYVSINNVLFNNQSFENIENNMLISSAISTLPDLQKIIIQETFFEKKTTREIAKDLHISKTKVCEQKNIALNELKNFLKNTDKFDS